MDTEALRPRVPNVSNASARYSRDAALNLFRRAAFEGIGYSDGPNAERYVHDIVRTAQDRGTFSEELARAIVDWPSEYHLSRERHCIVRPLGIKPGDRVLELGCGCGAITRYLGEIGAEVTAVEGARLRAETAAERCRDLGNVTIVHDDVLQFSTEQRFDWVLLVGVLEYAPVYSDLADAPGALLRAAAALLGPRGRLVVAIENKLGLKYFNGCGEDHLGEPYLGVQGLYGARTARTFGRAELAATVRAAGLPHVAFHYPFPDYKLPRVVLFEAAFSDPDFDAPGALARVQARDYAGGRARHFDEALAARELARNGLLAHFSNSFLLVAAREPCEGDGVLATAYAAQRKAEFAIETRFAREGDAIRVRKTRLDPQRPPRCRFTAGSTLENVTGETTYVPGSLAFEALRIARARNADLATIVTAFAPWFGFLLAQARSAGDRRLSDFTLPGDYVDVTPFNLVETAEGLKPIDMEWRVDRDIPLGWVVARSVLHCLIGTSGFEQRPVTVAEVVCALCAGYGLAVSATEVTALLDREDEMQQLINGPKLLGYGGELASRPFARPSAARAEQWALIGDATQLLLRVKVRIARLHRLRARRWLASDAARYGWAVLAVTACLAVTSLLSFSGVRTPYMLLYLAAVAIAARLGGPGPGVFALAASMLAIARTAPSLHLFTEGIASLERLGIFLSCAAVAILVSIPRASGESREGRERAPHS